MSLSGFILSFSLICSSLAFGIQESPKAIVLIYADDLGYGDIGAYGANRISTPHIDRLANEGMRFTHAYSTSATCTPSRYAMMTGEYPWRKKGTEILPGDAALILPSASERASLGSLMQRAGYKTMAIGKWHLGLGKGKVDWNKPIDFGPKEVGFDESFILPATGDRVPCVYVKNGEVFNADPNDPIEVSYQKNFEGEPLAKDHPELLRWKHIDAGHSNALIDGIGRIGYMKGGHSARWKDREMADVLTDQAVKFIEKNKGQKFFMYFGTNDIHAPRDPHQRFIGKSQCGIRGDVTVQLDHCVGRIMEALKKAGLEKDALVLFSSDNGPVIEEGYYDESEKNCGDHKPAGPLRGGKYSILEGGTRVPFIAWWPGKVPQGVSKAILSQMDIAPTLAELSHTQLKPGEFPDGQSQKKAFFDSSDKGREELITHGMGRALALRQNQWKYYLPGTVQRTSLTAFKNTSEKVPDFGALYDLENDSGEMNNVAKDYSEIVTKMKARLEEIKESLPK